MSRKGGWTRHAKSARKTRGVNQDKLTSLEAMSMLLAWRNPILETFSPDCSLEDDDDEDEDVIAY